MSKPVRIRPSFVLDLTQLQISSDCRSHWNHRKARWCYCSSLVGWR